MKSIKTFGLFFDLGKEEVKGSTERIDNQPGWFFVLEEPLTESRFGMDVPSSDATIKTWEDLAWHHIESNLTESKYVNDHLLAVSTTEIEPVKRPVYENGEPVYDGNGDQIFEEIEPANVLWNSHSANVAWITMQKPVRVAIHADDMLPSNDA